MMRPVYDSLTSSDPNLKDRDGKTALNLAKGKGHKNIEHSDGGGVIAVFLA